MLNRAANPLTPEDAIRFDVARVSDLRNLARASSTKPSNSYARSSLSAAALLEMHKVKGIPYHPAQDGFVFSKDQIETFSQRLIYLNQSRHIEHICFHATLVRHASTSPPPTTHNPPYERPKCLFGVILKVATSTLIAT